MPKPEKAAPLSDVSRMSLDEFLIALAHENEHLIKANQRDAFAELVRRTAPLDHMAALIRFALSFKWKLFFPPGAASTITELPPAATRRAQPVPVVTPAQLRVDVARERARSLGAITVDMVMPDGRSLGEWTVGELRALGGVFDFILKRAGERDDQRRIADVMSARDWKAANGKRAR